jgi:cholesterol oxidase
MLSSPWEQRQRAYDFVVVGSGYGGAIAAARLATARLSPKTSICILERGKEWLPGGFPESAADVAAATRSDFNPLGLYELLNYQDISVFKGSGLGGTSLINANVVMMPDREAFDRAGWPRALAYDTLLPHYQRAREVLGANPHPRSFQLPKVQALARRAAEIGIRPEGLDLAVNFTIDGMNPHGVPQEPCIDCGNCVTGCQVGAKNTLPMNYLPMARAAGAQILTQAKVEWIEKLIGGGWRIHGRHYDSSGASEAFTLDAREVIMAAGAINSTEILMRSQMHGLSFSPALGSSFSGNGDFLAAAYNGRFETQVVGLESLSAPLEMGQAGQPGPNIVGAIRYNFGLPVDRRFMVQETSFPGASVAMAKACFALLRGEATASVDEVMQRSRLLADLNPATAARADGALNHSMIYLVTGFEDPHGSLLFETPWTEPAGRVKIVWDGADRQIALSGIREELRRHARALGASFIANPLWSLLHVSHHITVHPLGGCPMGEDYLSGAVDEFGRVFAGDGSVHQGLSVVDGALIPAALGVPPLLTISALAEYIVERKIRALAGDAYPRPRRAVGAADIEPADVTAQSESDLERLFRRFPSMGIETLLNRGEIVFDPAEEIIENGSCWRAFLPKGHVLNHMSAAFLSGIRYSFQRQNDRYLGIAGDQEQRLQIRLSAEEISAGNGANDIGGTAILARYLDSPWEGFHTVFKAIGENLMIGRAYVGVYPTNVVRLFTFALTRRYTVFQMTAAEHRTLFESGAAPAGVDFAGTWRVDVVSNANHIGALAYLNFEPRPDGRWQSRCHMPGLVEYLLMPIEVEDHFQLSDFTPFHDEVRKAGQLVLGCYVTGDSRHPYGPTLGSLDVLISESPGRSSFRYILSRPGSPGMAGPTLLQQYLDIRLPDGIGVSYQEEYTGDYVSGTSQNRGREADLALAERFLSGAGSPGNASPCTVRLTATITDVNDFVESGIAHEALLRGTISFANFPEVGQASFPVEEGRGSSGYVRINEATGEAEIEYRLEFESQDLRRFVLKGRKYLCRDERGSLRTISDCLADYTTLFAHLFERDTAYDEAHGEQLRELGAAYLRFNYFQDLVASRNRDAFLSLFTVTGTQDRTLASFAKLRYLAFMGRFLRADPQAASGVDLDAVVVRPPPESSPFQAAEETDQAAAATIDTSLPRVLICYRPEDSAGWAMVLYDRLAASFGPAQVVMDIAPMQDPQAAIARELAVCDAVIAVIGQQWLATTDSQGRRLLDDPGDLVRLEIEAALGRRMRLIPALVAGAAMPNSYDLPVALATLARRQPLEMRETNFDEAVEKLIAALSLLKTQRVESASS